MIHFLAASILALPQHATASQDGDRRALITALESLIATGEPRHASHDEGERLQLAVDAAIARGDQEIERLAIRAASPLTASVTRPVSSTRDLPAISFQSVRVLRVRRPLAYKADIYASVDGGEFVLVRTLQSGKGAGGRIDALLPASPAAAPGFHAVRFKAELTFGAAGNSADAWTETRTLPAGVYAIYDPIAESDAAIRTLVYGPAATAVREFDPLLGDEPFATWLTGVFGARRSASDSGPDWSSQYCDERTGEAGSRPVPTAICSVVYFQVRGEIGQIWFRTADIREADGRLEWIPVAPPRFEGMVLRESAQQSHLSSLPTLLDTNPASRPVGDVSIVASDIVISPTAPGPGAFADTTVTVRNIGDGDLHKVAVVVFFGTDPAARPTTRQFVVEIPAHESADLKLQVAFPSGYGFIMAHAMQTSEHAPFDGWTPDPTPENACAFHIVNPRLAPPKYVESLGDSSGCGGR